MPYVLLVLHIATAIVFIGGMTVSASVFPRYATVQAAAPFAETGGHPAALAMHRITTVYGRLSIITPVIGLILALVLGRLGDVYIWVSIVLVALGGIVLATKIIPSQRAMLQQPPEDAGARRRAMLYPGTLNLIWLIVLILMIVKPGAAG